MFASGSDAANVRARNTEIWKKWKAGASIASLAAMYGLTTNYISSCISHREQYYNSPEYQEKARKAYIKEKIKILKQLDIKVTDDVKDHLNSLETELEIDQYAHKLIMDR